MHKTIFILMDIPEAYYDTPPTEEQAKKRWTLETGFQTLGMSGKDSLADTELDETIRKFASAFEDKWKNLSPEDKAKIMEEERQYQILESIASDLEDELSSYADSYGNEDNYHQAMSAIFSDGKVIQMAPEDDYRGRNMDYYWWLSVPKEIRWSEAVNRALFATMADFDFKNINPFQNSYRDLREEFNNQTLDYSIELLDKHIRADLMRKLIEYASFIVGDNGFNIEDFDTTSDGLYRGDSVLEKDPDHIKKFIDISEILKSMSAYREVSNDAEISDWLKYYDLSSRLKARNCWNNRTYGPFSQQLVSPNDDYRCYDMRERNLDYETKTYDRDLSKLDRPAVILLADIHY